MPHGVYIPVLLMRRTQFCKPVLRIRLVLNPQNTIFRSEALQILFLGFSPMATTRKQKKARKSRGLPLLSGIENLDIMLAERHLVRDESANSSRVIQPEGRKVSLVTCLEMVKKTYT